MLSHPSLPSIEEHVLTGDSIVINKKNLLGKTPDELGTKDAIHVAIVAVRAAATIAPGERCSMNKRREAEPNANGCGVADPFFPRKILTGQPFWLLLNQDAVPNVRHVWEHPEIDFTPPAHDVQLNKNLAGMARALGLTYEQLIAAGIYVIEHNEPAKYVGTLTSEELEAVLDGAERDGKFFEMYDFWSELSDEIGHEFSNVGSACCPEYEYPEELFNA